MRRLSWKLREKKKVAQQENKQAAAWPCGLRGLMKSGEKADDSTRWMVEGADGWMDGGSIKRSIDFSGLQWSQPGCTLLRHSACSALQ